MKGHTMEVCRNLIFDSNKRKAKKGNRFGNKNKRFNRNGKGPGKQRKQGSDNDRRVAAIQQKEDVFNTGN